MSTRAQLYKLKPTSHSALLLPHPASLVCDTYNISNLQPYTTMKKVKIEMLIVLLSNKLDHLPESNKYLMSGYNYSYTILITLFLFSGLNS